MSLASPLPILVTTHRRPQYLRLALNSLFFNLPDPTEKVCIVASNPDPLTLEILNDRIRRDSRVEVVTTEENLGYAVGNFGIKWFNLPRFIHFEDDFILPSHTQERFPYWTRQMAEKMKNYDLVAFQTSMDNAPGEMLRGRGFPQLKFPMPPSELLSPTWHLFNKCPDGFPPINGNGLAIDSRRLYGKPPPAPRYCRTDFEYYRMSHSLALTSLKIYHLGYNQIMDGLGRTNFTSHRDIPCAPPIVAGVDLRTGVKREIDLTTGYPG